MEFGLQLYSIAEETKKDFVGSLKKVADLGYKTVEFAGYGDIPAREMRKVLDGYGLRSVGAHVGSEGLRNDLDREIEYNHEIGSKYIILPMHNTDTVDDTKRIVDLLNSIEDKCKQAGLTVGYHNHAHEFIKFGDKYALDMIFEDTNAVMELDVMWVAVAKLDVVSYIKKNADICKLLHLKECKDDAGKIGSAIGHGPRDFAPIMAVGKEIGVLEYVVELEHIQTDIWECAKQSIEYLKSV